MPPQPRSGIKPDPTMLLCYVPDLVFTLIRDEPSIYPFMSFLKTREGKLRVQCLVLQGVVDTKSFFRI